MLHWFGNRWWFGRKWRSSKNPAIRYPLATTRLYYQNVHNTNNAYKSNNWLLTEIDAILSIKPKSILEIGCGNGRFIAAIKNEVERVIGVDWARSPLLAELNVLDNFELLDITKDELPKADLVCSADVLEHISPILLPPTLRRLHHAGREQYHVISCYDDGHSHLSILEPHMWLRAFRTVSKRYRILEIRQRRNHPSQSICIISTFQPSVPA